MIIPNMSMLVVIGIETITVGTLEFQEEAQEVDRVIGSTQRELDNIRSIQIGHLEERRAMPLEITILTKIVITKTTQEVKIQHITTRIELMVGISMRVETENQGQELHHTRDHPTRQNKTRAIGAETTTTEDLIEKGRTSKDCILNNITGRATMRTTEKGTQVPGGPEIASIVIESLIASKSIKIKGQEQPETPPRRMRT